MTTLSIDYALKLRTIRKTEKLTQEAFADMVGLSLSTVKAYESGRKKARAEVLEKVLQVDKFRKYTAWLLYGDNSLKFNQVTPQLVEDTSGRTRADKGDDKKYEKVVEQISSQKPGMQVIIISLLNLDDDELKQLAKQLSRQGIMSLLDFLDPENQSLVNLEGKKRRAALRLESMSGEQLREILSRIEECDTLPKDDINDSIENS